MLNQQLIHSVTNWMSQDPDIHTRDQLQKLLTEAESNQLALKEIADAFSGPLQFGTAGLRGSLGPGPNRMNRVTVLRAAAGLGHYLLSQGFANQTVVIGYDARHNSAQFAEDTAEVLAGLGLRAAIFGDVVPTPVLAFAILDQNACAGVMVTASHNPAQDNGYKVYLGDGRQIVSPVDKQISERIEQIDDVRLLPHSHDILTLGQDVLNRYVEATSQIVNAGPIPRDEIEAVRYVYTALHGVGYRAFSYVMNHAGFSQPDCVEEQQHPDPDFPTVAFPNPEEPGALDLAIALATTLQSQVVIAHDPDADRLAVALPNESGEWVQLRGDEIGVLLGWWFIERSRRMNTPCVGTFANSIVSSSLLREVALSAGLKHEVTLTGFKWVSRVPDLLYGYEEALGYCIDPQHVKDKDGISAGMLVLEMCAALHAEGKSAFGVLANVAQQFGLHQTRQLSIRITDMDDIEVAMTKLRERPPVLIGEYPVQEVIDLALGSHLPPTNGIIFTLDPGEKFKSARIIVRPSGTEPKIKCYLEVVVPNSRDANVDIADGVLSDIQTAMHTLLVGQP